MTLFGSPFLRVPLRVPKGFCQDQNLQLNPGRSFSLKAKHFLCPSARKVPLIGQDHGTGLGGHALGKVAVEPVLQHFSADVEEASVDESEIRNPKSEIRNPKSEAET